MSSYGKLVTRLWSENILYSAMLELTYRCNLDCYFCYNDLSLEGRPLSTEQYVDLLGQLHDLGTMNLTLTGGEPLTHRDFFYLGRKAREYGFVVRVKTNGHALTGKLARRLKDEVDPFGIEVSLHGACAETHDRQTRVKGSFDRLMLNLPQILSMGLRVKINSTLTVWNESEMAAMYEIADRLGVTLSFDPQVTPRDDGDMEPLSIRPSSDAVKRLHRLQKLRYDQQRFKAKSGNAGQGMRQGTRQRKEHHEDRSGGNENRSGGSKYCGTGSAGVTIDPYGNVYPCVQWRKPVGNVHEQTIGEIWKNSRALEDVRRAGTEVKEFVDGLGDAGRMIGFCPALALMSTGRVDQLYPGASQRLKIRQEELAAEDTSHSDDDAV